MKVEMPLRAWLSLLPLVFCVSVRGQVIEFESGGLKYQTLSRSGLTVMFAPLPLNVRHYAVIQVAVSNGADKPVTVHPEDFVFERQPGSAVRAESAERVVGDLLLQLRPGRPRRVRRRARVRAEAAQFDALVAEVLEPIAHPARVLPETLDQLRFLLQHCQRRYAAGGDRRRVRRAEQVWASPLD